MAVVAVLKVQFAQTITFGVVIGDFIFKSADPYLRPALYKLLPDEYAKWVPLIVKYLCRSIGISVSWFLQRIVSGFSSALRGAEIFLRGTLAWTARNFAHYPKIETNSLTFSGVAFVFAMIGFLWQLSRAFTLPFPLNILLFPFSMIEYFLMYMVGIKDV